MTASNRGSKVGSAVRVALVALVAIGVWVTRAGTRWPSIYYMTGQSMQPTLAPNVTTWLGAPCLKSRAETSCCSCFPSMTRCFMYSVG